MGEQKNEKRSLEQLIEMVLYERLDAILEEPKEHEDNSIMDHGEAVIDSLPEEQKTAIQAYVNLLLDHEAESNEQAYRGGFHDAIGLLTRLTIIAEGYEK